MREEIEITQQLYIVEHSTSHTTILYSIPFWSSRAGGSHLRKASLQRSLLYLTLRLAGGPGTPSRVMANAQARRFSLVSLYRASTQQLYEVYGCRFIMIALNCWADLVVKRLDAPLVVLHVTLKTKMGGK